MVALILFRGKEGGRAHVYKADVNIRKEENWIE